MKKDSLLKNHQVLNKIFKKNKTILNKK